MMTEKFEMNILSNNFFIDWIQNVKPLYINNIDLPADTIVHCSSVTTSPQKITKVPESKKKKKTSAVEPQ